MWHKIQIIDINGNFMYVENVQFDTIKPIEKAVAYQVRAITYCKAESAAELNLLHEELGGLIDFLKNLDRIWAFVLLTKQMDNDYAFDMSAVFSGNIVLITSILQSGTVRIESRDKSHI